MKNKIALITGASSGIGAAFARLLAGKGYNVWITGRRRDRLEALAREIKQSHPVSVEIIQGDLLLEKDICALEQKIKQASDLEVLVNNAGYGDDVIFESSPVKMHTDMLRVHVEASVRLAHAALTPMLDNKTGYILNVSSIAGLVATGGSVSYNATKAYLIRFSEALSLNLHDAGIRVSALCPGFTHTDFHAKMGMDEADKRRWSRNWMAADRVAHLGWKAILRGGVVYIPGWRNKLMIGFVNLLPPRLRLGLARIVSAKSRKSLENQ